LSNALLVDSFDVAKILIESSGWHRRNSAVVLLCKFDEPSSHLGAEPAEHGLTGFRQKCVEIKQASNTISKIAAAPVMTIPP
jgi:hypothetical protein